VYRWSNRFSSPRLVAAVSMLAAVSILSACRSSPSEEAPAAVHPPSGSGDAAAPSAGAPVGAASGAPVPPQASQQYAEALKLMKAGRTAEAQSQLKQLAGAYPTLAGPEVNLGLLYLQASQLPEAEAAFKAALERSPGNAVAGNELGITERKLGKFAEAEAAYQRTIAAQPDYAAAYLNLGVLYDLYLAEPQKALEQYERYIQLAGDNKQVAGWMVELRKRVGAAAPAVKKEPA
jgi:tetratricopeptide (TPR) repeat protein